MAQLEPVKQRMTKYTMKLDTVLKRAKLPEIIEKMIALYTLDKKHKRFLDKYRHQNASFVGAGWISCWWNPNLRSSTRDRWLWNVFAKDNFRWYPSNCQWGKDMKAPFVTMKHLKPLEGKSVLIIYKNAQGNVTQMYPKRIVSCWANQFRVSDPGSDTQGFVLNNNRVLRVDLFVDIER